VYLFPTALIVVVKVQHEHKFTFFKKTIRFKKFTSEHLVPHLQLRQIYLRLQNTEIYKPKYQAHTRHTTTTLPPARHCASVYYNILHHAAYCKTYFVYTFHS
jgi:hypothetical protein